MKITLDQLESNFKNDTVQIEQEKSIIKKISEWIKKFWEVVEL